MGVYETFSQRLKKEQGEGIADVFTYDKIPSNLKVQIIQIMDDTIGKYEKYSEYHENREPPSTKIWEYLHKTLLKEFGVFYLGVGGSNKDKAQQVKGDLLYDATETSRNLDLIQLVFQVIKSEVGKWSPAVRLQSNATQTASDAIDELNKRFLQHAVGYQFENGILIRVDSEFAHKELIKPVLQMLQKEGFEGALSEFLKAHEHYRSQNTKDAMTWALKSFESTIKTICDARNWSYSQKATATPLVEILIENELLPKELQSHFSCLVATLKNGLPTLRNNKAGHGDGQKTLELPPCYASYAINLAATSIMFLIQAHRTKK
jgi:hypothetical protein